MIFPCRFLVLTILSQTIQSGDLVRNITHLIESMLRLMDSAKDAENQISRIKQILDNEPDPCPEHPDDDVVSCGWKNDIIVIRNIINYTKEES